METERNNANERITQLRALVMETDATHERTEDRLQQIEDEKMEVCLILLALYFYNHIILTLIHQLQYNIIHPHTHTRRQRN